MQTLSPVNSHDSVFSHARVSQDWQAWLRHIERYPHPQEPSSPGSQAKWLGRKVLPSVSALPFFTQWPAARHEVPGLWQDIHAGNTLASQKRTARLAKTSSQGIKTSQNLSEALLHLFMAQERYQQSILRAAFKEAEAAQEGDRFNWHNTIQDLLREQEYNNLMLECLSNMIRNFNETCSRIIANI